MHVAGLTEIGVLRERVTLAATGTTGTAYSSQVPEGERWFVQSIAIRDDTTAGAECEVAAERSGFSHVFRRLGPVAANEFYADVLETWLLPRERLQFNWSGVANGDGLEMHVTGRRFREGE